MFPGVVRGSGRGGYPSRGGGEVQEHSQETGPVVQQTQVCGGD